MDAAASGLRDWLEDVPVDLTAHDRTVDWPGPRALRGTAK